VSFELHESELLQPAAPVALARAVNAAHAANAVGIRMGRTIPELRGARTMARRDEGASGRNLGRRSGAFCDWVNGWFPLGVWCSRPQTLLGGDTADPLRIDLHVAIPVGAHGMRQGVRQPRAELRHRLLGTVAPVLQGEEPD